MPRIVKLKPMKPEELQAYRTRHGMTQGQLAAQVKISIRTVQQYEQGGRPIPEWFRNTLYLLAKTWRAEKKRA